MKSFWCILMLGLGCTAPIQDHSSLGTLPLMPSIPVMKGDYKAEAALDSGWIDVQDLDSTIVLDIRYATQNNFAGIQLYPCARCLLRKEVAIALASVHVELKKEGLGLKLFDCYRPWSVQDALWQKMPDARYVTRPDKGSMHNRGSAVDLTLIDKTGNELDMGTGYDFFGEEAYHTFTGLPDSILERRIKLKDQMANAGFQHIRTEWWHYSFQLHQYEISDYRWPCPDKVPAPE